MHSRKLFYYLSLASEKCGMKKTVGRYFSIKIYISNNEERYRESLRSYVLEKLKFNLQAKVVLFHCLTKTLFLSKIRRRKLFHPDTIIYHMICLFPCLYIHVLISCFSCHHVQFFRSFWSLMKRLLELWAWLIYSNQCNKRIQSPLLNNRESIA